MKSSIFLLILNIIVCFGQGNIFTEPITKSFASNSAPTVVGITSNFFGSTKYGFSYSGQNAFLYNLGSISHDNLTTTGSQYSNLGPFSFYKSLRAGVGCIVIISSPNLLFYAPSSSSGPLGAMGNVRSADTVYTKIVTQYTTYAIIAVWYDSERSLLQSAITTIYDVGSWNDDFRNDIQITGNLGVRLIKFDGLNKLVLITLSNDMYLLTIGVLSDPMAVTTSYGTVSNTRTAVVIDKPNQRFISCGTLNSQLVIEIASYTNSETQVLTINTTLASVSSCLSIEYDGNRGQLFMVVTDSTSNYLVSTTLLGTGTKLTVLSNTVPGTPGSTSLNYPLILDTTTVVNTTYIYALGASSSDTVLVGFKAASLCPNDCSGSGSCYLTTCTCYNGHFYDDCSGIPPSITSLSKLNYQGTNQLTIYGTNFINTNSITVNVAGSTSCSDFVVNSTVITCLLPSLYNLDLNPFNQQSVFVTMDGIDTQVYNSILFNNPQITAISQSTSDGTVSIQGTSFFTSQYMKIFSSSHQITTFTVYSSAIQCGFDTLIKTGYFSLLGTDDTVYGNMSYIVLPFLTQVSPNTITTAAINVTISGRGFQANPDSEVTVQQGEATPVSPIIILNDNTLIAETTNYFESSKSIRVVIKNNGDKYLNSFNLSYIDPLVTGESLEVSNNTYTFKGTNFPGILSEITFDPEMEILSQDLLSTTIQIPNTFKNNDSFSLNFYGEFYDSFMINLPLNITSIDPIDIPVSGGIVTVTGNYLLGNSYINISTFDSQLIRLECNPLSTINYPSKLECQFPVNTGPFSLYGAYFYNFVEYFTSTYQSSYLPPTIETITPTSYSKGIETNFTITGQNFVNINATVLINDEECSIITDSIIYTQIICNITSNIDPSTISNPVSVMVTINTFSGSKNDTIFYEKPCLNDCSKNGTCNLSTGICKCKSGFTGTDCSTPPATQSPSSSSLSELNLAISFVPNLIFITLAILSSLLFKL